MFAQLFGSFFTKMSNSSSDEEAIVTYCLYKKLVSWEKRERNPKLSYLTITVDFLFRLENFSKPTSNCWYFIECQRNPTKNL